MKYFDMHCDTLYRCTLDSEKFYGNNYHISFDRTDCFNRYVQFMAIWIPDKLIGYDRTRMFIDACKVYNKEKVNNKNITTFLTVENASMLNGKLSNIYLLKENDVKAITLTWNEDNELGSGAYSSSKFGLTDFGKTVIDELNKNDIKIDVSHASDRLFYEIVEYTDKPIFASHSNSRKITDNIRNLTDEMFNIIKDRNGVVGINLYRGFLNNNEYNANIDDILRHVYHFLELGGENSISFGADFDGADMPNDIKGIQDIPKIYERFNKTFGEKITNKIFFDNGKKFFKFFD